MVDPHFRRWLLHSLLAGLALLLAACRPATSLPDPTEFPEAVLVQYTPALRILTPVLEACAAEDPDLALFLEETPKPAIDLSSDPDSPVRLGLALGEPLAQNYSAALTDAQIAVITHPSNPIQEISAAGLQELFSGQIQNWAAIGGSDQTVTPWVLTPADEARQLFEKAILGESKVSGQARLAADPAWMLASVSTDPGAVGYVPAAWLNDSVNVLKLAQGLSEELRLPLLALAGSEPQGAARRLLVCLQSGSGQAALKMLFQAP
ncbi:MAG TPA: substrate-binding domain-containing protein [Anaerolineales bacterium]|nr:substrate-binding domain-containing protein [Anaerolineales bacterium]